MINKNTQQNNSVNIGTISESTIYLKKSELPKNVSSFKNDVGYISESALNTWLKEHSYLSKNEINTLISKANLVVVDKINKTYDDDALTLLTEKVNNLSGEVTKLKDKLPGFISIDKEDSFATKSDLSGVNSKITNINTKLGNINTQINQINTTSSQKADKSEIPTKVSQLENDVPYLTQQDLNGFVKESKLTSTLKDYAKKSSLPAGTIATQEWVESQNFLTEEQDLSNLVKRTELQDYVKTSTLNSKLSNVVRKPELNNYALKQWVLDQNYIKETQDLSEFAKKSDLQDYIKATTFNSKFNSVVKKTDLNDYVKKDWIEQQGFITEVQDLKDYAKKSELADYVKSSALTSKLSGYAKTNTVYTKGEIDANYYKKPEADNIFAKKTDVESTYLKKIDAANKYLLIEDYRGLRDATVIGEKNSLDDLRNELSTLRNGFYIVNKNDIVVVKDNKIISMFKEGIPQVETDIYWETD